MSMNSISDKRTRAEIRRRMAQMPPSRAMFRQLLRVIEGLRKENDILRRQLGH